MKKRVEPWHVGILAFVVLFFMNVWIASLIPARAYEPKRLSELASAPLAHSLEQEAEKIIGNDNYILVVITPMHGHTHLTVHASEAGLNHSHFYTVVINDSDPTLDQLVDATEGAAKDIADQIPH